MYKVIARLAIGMVDKSELDISYSRNTAFVQQVNLQSSFIHCLAYHGLDNSAKLSFFFHIIHGTHTIIKLLHRVTNAEAYNKRLYRNSFGSKLFGCVTGIALAGFYSISDEEDG